MDRKQEYLIKVKSRVIEGKEGALEIIGLGKGVHECSESEL